MRKRLRRSDDRSPPPRGGGGSSRQVVPSTAIVKEYNEIRRQYANMNPEELYKAIQDIEFDSDDKRGAKNSAAWYRLFQLAMDADKMTDAEEKYCIEQCSLALLQYQPYAYGGGV